MKTQRKMLLIYWISTSIIFLFEGVMPVLTSHTDLAVEGIRHLGYPDYFRVLLTVFKGLGALVLILPFVNVRIKEWAYAGFSFTMISAFVSHGVVDGFGVQTLFPLFIFTILITSYIYYHKQLKLRKISAQAFRQDSHLSSGLFAYDQK